MNTVQEQLTQNRKDIRGIQNTHKQFASAVEQTFTTYGEAIVKTGEQLKATQQQTDQNTSDIQRLKADQATNVSAGKVAVAVLTLFGVIMVSPTAGAALFLGSVVTSGGYLLYQSTQASAKKS